MFFSEISKIENLERLFSLQKLNLSNNRISAIENLEGLSQLKSLSLCCNQMCVAYVATKCLSPVFSQSSGYCNCSLLDADAMCDI